MDYTANDWLYLPVEQAVQLSSNSGFPFANVTPEQLYDLLDTFVYHMDIAVMGVRVGGPLISALGVVFTGLLIATLWRKAVVQKNGFYRAMLLIAVVDLLFNIFALSDYTLYKTMSVSGSSSAVLMQLLLVNNGLVYTLSCMSDMCAVVLTFERYLSIARVQLHRTLTEDYKNPVRAITSVLVIVISSTRMHYVVYYKVIQSDGLYFFALSELMYTHFVVVLTIISDMILPALLLVTMLVLSTLFRVVVSRRMKKRIVKLQHAAWLSSAPPTTTTNNYAGNRTVGLATVGQFVEMANIPSVSHSGARSIGVAPGPAAAPLATQTKAQQNPAKAAVQDLKSIMTLTLALDALFLLNQFGYCLYVIPELLIANDAISFNSTYEELSTNVRLMVFQNYVALESSLGEIVSHAANFPVYMCLSDSMRQDFRNLIRR